MHIVELRRSAAELAAVMAQIRIWLDHYRIEPTLFNSALSRSGHLRLRLQFKHGHDASAFVAVFEGAVFTAGDPAGRRAA
jgi:hypothetical protein